MYESLFEQLAEQLENEAAANYKLAQETENRIAKTVYATRADAQKQDARAIRAILSIHS